MIIVPATTANSLSTIPISGVSQPTAIPGANPSRTAVLTRRLAARDEDAFREFHALYFNRLYQFLLVIARGQQQEAEEALQETLLRVVKYAREFDDETAFWCWLKSVARSAARDVGRKQRRYLNLLERFTIRWGQSRLQTDFEESRLQSALADAMQELAPDDRRLIERKYFEGEAVRDLSSATGLTEKAIESRLVRLRRELKSHLLKKLKDYEHSR